jgi:hypothetical protein
MDIISYSDTHRDAIESMNAKLSAAGSEWQFPAEERPRDADGLPVWTESVIALEDDEAYGAYLLKHQQFFARGTPLDVGNLQLPVSLGDVDSRFSHISVALLFDVLRRSPRCYSLGFGSEEIQFAKLLRAARWRNMSVSFYFSVKSANRFARNIRLPSDKALMQRVLRVLGSLRAAGLAFWIRKLLRTTSDSGNQGLYDSAREVARFDVSADELFAAHAESYALVGDRRAAALNCLYPERERKYLRLLVERGGSVIGWAVLLDTQMRDDKYFGNMRVGSLVDCFAGVQDVAAVVAAASDALKRRGVDLIVSNQLHPAWCEALGRAGYQSGPSNFFFYYSEELSEALANIQDWERGVHMNRGDGEGPANL